MTSFRESSGDTLTNPLVVDYYQKAIEGYNESIKISPDFIHAFYNRATVKAMLNKYVEAFLDLAYCIASDDGFAEAYFNRGLIQLLLGNKSLACRDLSQAGQMGIEEAYQVIYYSCN